MNKLFTFLFLLIIPLFCMPQEPLGVRHTLKFYRLTREYIVFSPKPRSDADKRPLVIVMHGGLFSARVIEKASRYNAKAEKDNVVVIYPQGLYYRWNTSLSSVDNQNGYNDVEFLEKLVDIAVAEYQVDPTQIFITGGSMGGLATWLFVTKNFKRVRAFAPMICGVGRKYMNILQWKKPTPVMMINGTNDPLVRYEGNPDPLVIRKGRGIAGAMEMASWIASKNRCSTEVISVPIPDRFPGDKCHAIRHTWKGAGPMSETVLIEVVNGGHTFSAEKKVLPRIVFGRTCQDFDAFGEVWDFFMSKRSDR